MLCDILKNTTYGAEIDIIDVDINNHYKKGNWIMSNHINIDELISQIKSGDFSKIASKFLKEREIKKEKIKSFIDTEEFKNNFQKLKIYLEINKSFGTNGIYYTETPDEIIFSNNTIQIFETIGSNNSLEEIPDANFPTCKTSYDGVNMSIMYGQGCFFRFWID